VEVNISPPSQGGTTVPFGRPFVVFGDGLGSYCRDRSQYCPNYQLSDLGTGPMASQTGDEGLRKDPSHLSGQRP